MKSVLAILATVLMFVASPAFASCDNISVTGISDEAEATLKLACQQALVDATSIASNPLGVDITDPNALSAYGIVAQEWARALGIAATELGIAVDTFLDTDAGKLTAALIIWQVAGESIAGFLIGIPLLALIILIGIRTARRAKIKCVTYAVKETNWRGAPKVSNVEYFSENETAMYWVAHAATIILSIWVISGVIF
jgi:hypothetical protein